LVHALAPELALDARLPAYLYDTSSPTERASSKHFPTFARSMSGCAKQSGMTTGIYLALN
jgi:hypothetical protein